MKICEKCEHEYCHSCKVCLAFKNNWKTCDNCRFYVRHYIIKDAGYKPYVGHCANATLNNKKTITDSKFKTNCGYWEPVEILKVERRKSIIKTLNDMESSLKEIAMLLNDDN